MAPFFNILTDDDARLMQSYDAAVTVFREAVASKMEEEAKAHPDLSALLQTAAAAMRLRPLPSEVNADEGALARLALSGLVVEKVFGAIGPHAATAAIGQAMRDTALVTTSVPKLKPLTQALLQAVASIRPDIARKMDGRPLEEHLADLGSKKGRPSPKAPPAL